MTLQRERIIPISIEDEMRSSYIDYAMSVIVSRALPDVRDGLKPVHRRVLYAMSELGLLHNRPYKKSARIVGETLGKYHPHGDSAVYDTMVRMVQPFSLRYPLVDGQGNFGSVDGDSPAAMRYTEARLARIAEEMLRDLDKNTVRFASNFDDSLQEPSVLPSMLPNLLVNGSSGIAVGMATNIPPHNLSEVIDGLVALMADPSLESDALMQYIKAPDFPTGGIIYGYDGVREAYRTGRGRVVMRAKAQIETSRAGRESIIVTEIPYQVNKSTLIEKIADLARDKKIEGISDIRDESDRDGMRIVMEMKRDAVTNVVLNKLYKYTSMQQTFGVNMLALVNGMPRVLGLKEIMQHFLTHREEIVVKRTQFDLDAAEKRMHILEGLQIALDNLDAVIETIRRSREPETAKNNLVRDFKLSEIQAKAILELRLQRLTGLERKKIEEERKEVKRMIEYYRDVLADRTLRLEIIKDELTDLKARYGDERRTQIVYSAEDFSVEDLIAEEEMVITISHAGYIKRTAASGYRRQLRGGRGITAAGTGKDDDFIEHMFTASTHHYILFFTNTGRCYWQKVYEIPEGSRQARGRALPNLLQLKKEEKIAAFINVRAFDDEHFIMMVTKNGIVKKTVLSAYGNPRRDGIIAVGIREDDELLEARLTDGTHSVVIGTSNGTAIHFNEDDVRDMGRNATGVKGVELVGKDYVVGMVTTKRPDATILVVTEHGFGKRSDLVDYRTQRRGGKGIKTLNVTDKVGKLVAIKDVEDADDLMIITTNGVLIRQHIKSIRVMGRNTQGVKLIRLGEKDRIAAVSRVVADNSDEMGEDGDDEELDAAAALVEDITDQMTDDTGAEPMPTDEGDAA